ncbi:rhomboid family intramembrane serine protease [Chryseolinea lacunae]|uniref:Rhomboid family intramembrane serine protease n=1 Tax=Chryseolinea lacunae TaxID=2801331 RepID=A0ABS1KL71_9BACT|nr:rhomboid family intramembrane serine protease [Chryseolinea lacunae]MBL0740191.1 rhomboid family intramembrane serine protease [Chryseolinea lacunae]
MNAQPETYITYVIMAVTIAFSFYAFNRAEVLRKFMMTPYLIHSRKQYYRFVSSGFIHNDHMHLLLNMFSFYFFGRNVEFIFRAIFGPVLGGVYFVALYIMAIVVSDLPTFLKQKNNPAYSALGASGGVAAIIFASIIFQPLNDICLYAVLCFPGFILGTLYVVFSYYQGRKANDGINHDAHLYGALFGLVFCIVMYPDCIPFFIEQLKGWKYFQMFQ